MADSLQMTRKELTVLAVRLSRLGMLFRRKSDAAPVTLAAKVMEALVAGKFAVTSEPAARTTEQEGRNTHAAG